MCHFCETLVMIKEVIVHHQDHDSKNHEVLNLKPCHFGCHTRYHSQDPARKAKIAARMREPEVRAKKSKSMSATMSLPENRKRAQEHAQKMWAPGGSRYHERRI